MNAQQRSRSGRAHDTELTIREACERFGLTLRALRFYETKGLLKPRRNNRSRFYSEADMQRLESLLALKGFGFSLGEIKALLGIPMDGRRYPLTAPECDRQIALLRERREEIDSAIRELSEFRESLRIDPVAIETTSLPHAGLQPDPLHDHHA
jgi:DNA-binding transcriptional MerR regulator